MPRTIRVTEENLRAAMRDERYWRSGHPERQAFVEWVTSGYRGLYPQDGATRISVWVRAYVRDGHQVSPHWRSIQPSGGRNDESSDTRRTRNGAIEEGSGEAELILANWRSIIRRGPNRAPADRESGGPLSSQQGRGRHPRRRGPNGGDPVDDLRGDPGTQREGNLRDRVDQWSRPAGETGRDRDLERLRLVGPPTERPDGARIYSLEDGRIAISRPSTTPGSNGVPTLEIMEPGGRAGRFRPTDKFRYPPGR